MSIYVFGFSLSLYKMYKYCQCKALAKRTTARLLVAAAMDILLEPKAELDAPSETQSAKPKFQPKAKPRGKARGPAPAPAPSSKPQSQPLQQIDEPKPQPLLQIKTEAPLLEDPMIIDIKPKLEPVDSGVTISQPFVKVDKDDDVEMKPETVVGIKVEAAKEEEEEEEEEEEKASTLPGSPSLVQNEDTVVREIDVYLCPNITDTKLYLLQYPLRPNWRPYGLEERCDSVRVKPKLTRLEMDLTVDTTGENYDQDADEHLLIKKQTLSSSKAGLSTNYAVGLLRGNKIHLAPLNAILQMRPSMKYLDEADVKKKNSRKVIEDEDMVDAEDDEEEEKEEKPQLVALKVEVKKQETERQEQLRLQSHAHLMQLDAAEPWITLETHGTDSPITDQIRHSLISTPGDRIPFGMPLREYINRIVPGRASVTVSETTTHDAGVDEGLSRSFLDSLSLEQRFEKLLSKGRVHVLQFERLMKLAPAGCTEEEVLSVLEDMAHLVQGCWVAASSLRYTGQICIIRDYILSLFTKNRVIRHDQLEELHVPKEMIREVLLPLAVQRPTEGGWEFQESTDRSFLKRHQTVAKEQMQRWTENEEQIKLAALGLKIGTSSSKSSSISHHTSGVQLISGDKIANAIQSGLGRSKTSTFSGEWTMSEETRAALPAALREIFMKHNVCSLQLICQSLRELAITKAAAPNANPKVVAAAVAAAKGASAPLPELTAAVSQVASNIDNVYFLTKLGNPSLDPFRDVVIALLRAKGATTGLKRLDIIEASKIALKTEVQTNVYQKVLKELCYTKGGAWVLKPGDGRPAQV